MRLRGKCKNSPNQLLPLLLFLFLRLLDLFQPHNKHHLDRRRRTLPPQWRDPCISSLLLLLLLPLLLQLFLPLLVYVVILSAAKNPRIFEGSEATRMPSPPATPITNVISTEGGALCRRSGEIPVFRLCPCGCCCRRLSVNQGFSLCISSCNKIGL